MLLFARLSIFYLVNQIFGPGGLAMPIVMKQAGWAPSLTMLLFFSFTACLAATMLCAAMRLIPGNDRY
jgi:amino acid permease